MDQFREAAIDGLTGFRIWRQRLPCLIQLSTRFRQPLIRLLRGRELRWNLRYFRKVVTEPRFDFWAELKLRCRGTSGWNRRHFWPRWLSSVSGHYEKKD